MKRTRFFHMPPPPTTHTHTPGCSRTHVMMTTRDVMLSVFAYVPYSCSSFAATTTYNLRVSPHSVFKSGYRCRAYVAHTPNKNTPHDRMLLVLDLYFAMQKQVCVVLLLTFCLSCLCLEALMQLGHETVFLGRRALVL